MRRSTLAILTAIAMAGGFWDWVNASLRNEPERRSGAILELSFDSHVTGELEFRDALPKTDLGKILKKALLVPS